jgi:hypothetical protein
LFFSQSEVDRYRAELIGQAIGAEPVYPAPRDPDVLIPASELERQVGLGRRTIGRRIRDSQGGAQE